MPEKPEFVPPDEYVETVKKQVVGGLLQRAAQEIGHPLKVRMKLVCDGAIVKDLGELEKGTGEGPCQVGELRIRFRSTVVRGRFLFFLDSVFDDDSRASSFSGFRLRGDVRLAGSELVAEFKTWVVKRFDKRWVKWL